MFFKVKVPSNFLHSKSIILQELLKHLHKTVFHFLDLQEVLPNDCEHSIQITHTNLYFETMLVNLFLRHFLLHQYVPFCNNSLILETHCTSHMKYYFSYTTWSRCCSLTFRLFHVIRNSFSSFCRIGMNTNKSNSSWSLLSSLNTIDSHVCEKIDSPRKFIPFQSWPERLYTLISCWASISKTFKQVLTVYIFSSSIYS